MVGHDEATNERRRAAAQHVDFEPPRFLQVKGDTAYFVMPGHLTWKQRNGSFHDMRAQWVVTEVKTPKGWRISSHAWAPVTEDVRK